jgi:raffinose/stachyose/melibiose transport system permease protein
MSTIAPVLGAESERWRRTTSSSSSSWRLPLVPSFVFTHRENNREIVSELAWGPPQSLVWENFPEAWDVGNFATTTRNSGILVAGTVIGVPFLGGMAAYSLAKLDLPGAGLTDALSADWDELAHPALSSALFFTWQRLGLVNNLFGLVLIYIATNAPFAIFLLRSYMLQLPRDFEDAARVDGASEWQVFAKIVVPLSWPGFLTVGLVVALSVWNEFLLATVFLTEQELFTVVTSYYNFATRFSRDWTMTSAAAIMMILR